MPTPAEPRPVSPVRAWGRSTWRPSPGLLLAVLVFLAATVAVTWPAAFQLRRVLVGHPGTDTWNHVWGFWWVAEEILTNGRWPSWTNLIAWPRGGSLFFIDTFNAVLTLPIQAVWGPVAAYNLTVMGSLFFSAFAAWLLARYVVRDDVAALVTGLVYGFSPHVLAQAHNAITETLNLGWLALYFFLLLRLVDAPNPTRGAAAWAALVACGLSNWYYGLFAGLGTLILLAGRLLAVPVLPPLRTVVKWTLLGAIPFAPLALAGLWLLQSSIDAPDALVNRDPQFVWDSLLFHNISDFVGYFRPGKVYSPDLKALYGEELLIVTYLGWVAIGLSGVALSLERRRRDLLPWVVFGVVFWVFSLGPYLHVAGTYVELGGRRLPLPFLAFFEALPLFSRISHPFRFVVGVELALGILAAFAVRSLLRRLPARWGRPAGLAVCGLVFLEVFFVSPARLPLARSRATLSEAYALLREDPSSGAVLDLPLAVPILERAVYDWYQVYHRRPIPFTLNEPLAPGLRYNQLAQFLLTLEAGRARNLPRMLPDLELVISSRILARQGYRYVVVHDRLYPTVKREQVHTVLSGLLGPPLQDSEGGVTIYSLPVP